MTIVEAIQEVFEGIEPNGTFAFDSEVKGDAGERYKDKAVNTPFCLISPNVNGEATIVNSQFNDRLTLRVFFLTFIDDNWKTYAEIEANIVEPMRQLGMNTLTKVLYQYPTVVTVDETTNIPHTDIYKWGSGRHAGAMFTFSVKQKRELNLCSTPITFNIDLSSTEGGTATSSLGGEGNYPNVAKGTNIAISATPSAGSSFDYFDINGSQITTNPYCFEAVKDYDIVATFTAAVLTTFMDLLTTTPVQVGNEWRAVNSDGDSDNYGVINNQLVGNMASVNYGVITYANKLPYTESPSFEIIYKAHRQGTRGYFISKTSEYRLEQNSAVNSYSLIFRPSVSSGETNYIPTFKMDYDKWYRIGFSVDNSTQEVTIYSENLETQVYTEEVFNIGGTIDNSGSVLYVGNIDTLDDNTLQGLAHSYKINGLVHQYLNNKNGLDLLDSSGNEINGEFTNTIIGEFYSITDDIGIIEPSEYIKGVSIYSLNTDPTNEDEYINVVYSEAGTPALSTPPTGYSLVGHFPAGSGLLKGVSNTLTFNDSTELAAFAAKYPFFSTGVAYSYEQIRAWLTNEEVEKTEDDNSVSQLIFKQ